MFYVSKYDIFSFVPVPERQSVVNLIQKELQRTFYRRASLNPLPVICVELRDLIKIVGDDYYRKVICRHVSPCRKVVFMSYIYFISNCYLSKIIGELLFDSIKNSISLNEIYNIEGLKHHCLIPGYKKQQRKSCLDYGNNKNTQSSVIRQKDSFALILNETACLESKESLVETEEHRIFSDFLKYQNNDPVKFKTFELFDLYHDSFKMYPLFDI